jgi:hypothetical protein
MSVGKPFRGFGGVVGRGTFGRCVGGAGLIMRRVRAPHPPDGEDEGCDQNRGYRPDQRTGEDDDAGRAGKLAKAKWEGDSNLCVIRPDKPEHQSQKDRRPDQTPVDPEVADNRWFAPLVFVRHELTPLEEPLPAALPSVGSRLERASPFRRRRVIGGQSTDVNS